MSYVRIPGDLRGYNNLIPNPTDAAKQTVKSYQAQLTSQVQSTADQAKQQAIAFAETQLQNYPMADQVLAEYQQYKQYFDAIPGFNFADLKDPKKCVGLMKDVLTSYAKANGIPTNTKEFEAYAVSVAASEFGVDIPPTWPSNVKDLKSVAVDLACTAVAYETGIDPKALTVTADALMKGHLTQDECVSIGTTAGAIAGAAIGQAFGVPAPIGAFVGGLIGGDIGGTLGEIFGAGPSAEQEIQNRIDAAKKIFQKTLDQANPICDQARTAYWDMLDRLIYGLEAQWETAEVKIGWKFNLRWYGVETYTKMGAPFSQAWDPKAGLFTGPNTTANRAIVVKRQAFAVYYDENGVDKIKHTTLETYGCPYDYGCPYPSVTGVTLPQGFERDANAFWVRGIQWVAPADRKLSCSFKLPDDLTLIDPAGFDRWKTQIELDLGTEQRAVQALKVISVTVVGDLLKTAASVQAEKRIYDALSLDRAQLNQHALARSEALAKAKITGQNLSDFLNYGMLALGAGLLGAALWKEHRS